MPISADSILQADDLPRVRVDTPEWGEGAHVYVRMLTAAERDRWEAGLFVGEGKDRKLNEHNFRARMCVLTICDETGGRIFSDAQADALGRKAATVLARIYEAAVALNGIGAEAKEELGKPSAPAPISDSASGSPSPSDAPFAS